MEAATQVDPPKEVEEAGQHPEDDVTYTDISTLKSPSPMATPTETQQDQIDSSKHNYKKAVQFEQEEKKPAESKKRAKNPVKEQKI